MLTLPDPDEIPQWRSRVTIGGQVMRGVTDWDVDYTLGDPIGDTPFHIGRGEVSGSVTAMVPREPDAVADGRTPDPWVDPDWPPRPGATAVIEVSCDGTTWYPVASALADKPWDDSDGAAGVKVVDKVDVLSRTITLPPLLRIMPPALGLTNLREIGLHHAWVIDRALHEAGYYTTTPILGASSDILLRASLQGSLWASRGHLITGARDPSLSSIEAAFQRAPWGWCASGLSGTWRLGKTPDGLITTGTMGSSWQMTFLVGAGHTASASILLDREDGTGTYAQVAIYPDRAVSIWHGGTNVASLAASQVGTLVGLRRSGTSWLLWSTTADGVVHTATGTSATTATWTTCSLTGNPGARIGGLHIHNRGTSPVGTPSPTVWTPTARLGFGPVETELLNVLTYTEGMKGVTVRDVLDKVMPAVLGAYGTDETGNMLVQTWSGMTDGVGTRITLDTKADILGSLRRTWTLLDLAQQVQITYLAETHRVATDFSVLLWQGTGEQIKAGTTDVTFATPDADVEWLEIDTTVVLASSAALASTVWGTYAGGSIVTGTDSDGDDIVTSAGSGDYTIAMERIDFSTFKMTETASGSKTITRKTPEAKTLPAGWRGRDLPLIRGNGIVTRTEMTYVRAISGAVPVARTYMHDVGAWANPAFLDQLATTLADRMTDPVLLLDQVSIQPDPRIQVGDEHHLVSERLGLDLDVLVTGKKLSFTAAEGLAMTLDLSITGHQSSPINWRLRETLLTGSYSQLESTSASYAQLESNPLGVG